MHADDLDLRRLAVAVLQLALRDAMTENNHYRDQARHFLSSHALDLWATIIDLDPDTIREAIKSGLLTGTVRRGKKFGIVHHGDHRDSPPLPSLESLTCSRRHLGQREHEYGNGY
jgi:hypothetical protein